MTDGYNCYPICTGYTEGKKDRVKQGKQDKMHAQQEKQAKGNELKAAREKAKEAQKRNSSATADVS